MLRVQAQGTGSGEKLGVQAQGTGVDPGPQSESERHVQQPVSPALARALPKPPLSSHVSSLPIPNT